MEVVIEFGKTVSDADKAIEGDATSPEVDTPDGYRISPVEPEKSDEVGDVVVYRLFENEISEADNSELPAADDGATGDSTL